jgi:hypothetical protein
MVISFSFFGAAMNDNLDPFVDILAAKGAKGELNRSATTVIGQ